MNNAKRSSLLQALPLLSLLGLASCGSPADHSDGRTYGGDNINALARQVAGSGDATANPTPAKPGAPAPASPGATPASPAAPAAPAGPPPSTAVGVKAGVRNFQQVNATMAALTGEPSTTAAIATTFASLTTSLPTGNDVQAFDGSNQVAIFKLAVAYCNALSADTAKAPAAFGAANLTLPLGTVFTTAGTQAMATALITKFWGTNLASLPAQAASVANLSALITGLLQGKVLTSAQFTPAIATAACAATLSSAPVTLF